MFHSLLAVAALSAPPPVVVVFDDGTSVSFASTSRADMLLADTAAFLSDNASDWAEWVVILEPIFADGPASPGSNSPFGQCVTQAVSTCGQGKVCWVQFAGSGSQQGSCSFGCAITGATPPCPPPPSTVPPPNGTD